MTETSGGEHRHGGQRVGQHHDAAEWARAEVVEGRSWVLDEEWTTWRPPADWTAPALPDTVDVRAARSRTLRS